MRDAQTYRAARKAIVASMSPKTEWRDVNFDQTITDASTGKEHVLKFKGGYKGEKK